MECQLNIYAPGYQIKTIELQKGESHTETIHIEANTLVEAKVGWSDWYKNKHKVIRIRIIFDENVRLGDYTQNSQLPSLLFQLQQHTLEQLE